MVVILEAFGNPQGHKAIRGWFVLEAPSILGKQVFHREIRLERAPLVKRGSGPQVNGQPILEFLHDYPNFDVHHSQIPLEIRVEGDRETGHIVFPIGKTSHDQVLKDLETMILLQQDIMGINYSFHRLHQLEFFNAVSNSSGIRYR